MNWKLLENGEKLRRRKEVKPEEVALSIHEEFTCTTELQAGLLA
jgi:hypothetical protein